MTCCQRELPIFWSASANGGWEETPKRRNFFIYPKRTLVREDNITQKQNRPKEMQGGVAVMQWSRGHRETSRAGCSRTGQGPVLGHGSGPNAHCTNTAADLAMSLCNTLSINRPGAAAVRIREWWRACAGRSHERGLRSWGMCARCAVLPPRAAQGAQRFPSGRRRLHMVQREAASPQEPARPRSGGATPKAAPAVRAGGGGSAGRRERGAAARAMTTRRAC
jgi:hypothetical protein